MNDLISRQAAIDAICEECHMETDYHRCEGYKKDSRWCEYSTALNDLPSAQPDLDEWCTDVVEVVRCKDCKYRSKEWYEDKRNKDGGYWLVCCENDAIAERIYGLAQDNDYCSYGERADT